MRTAGIALACLIAACSNPFTTPPATPGVRSLTHVSADARPLVDAWAAALGGRRAVAAAGALHLHGTYSRGGLTGVIDLWQTPRGERREEITLGFLHELRVFDGQTGWLVDRNGEVRRLAGFELDDQLALAFLGTYAPLLPDRRPGMVARDAADALVLEPAGGNRTLTVRFDPVTHLPKSVARRDGEKIRTRALGDWHTIDGVRVPFAIDETTGSADDGLAIRIQHAVHVSPPFRAFARPEQRPSDAYLPAGPPVTVPIEVAYGGLVFVQVSINGTPMSFVLDTGAESTVLNASRLERLGLRGTGHFAVGAGGGDVVASYVPHVTTQVGEAKVLDQIVAAIPLDDLEKPLQRPLDGILGYDFLSRFIVELDYQGKTLRLYEPLSYAHAPTGAIPISLEDSTPFIDATIELPRPPRPTLAPALPGHFVLDTGCLCEVQLFTPFVNQHHVLDAVPDARQAGMSAGAGGETHELSGEIPALRVGAHTIDSPRADFSRDTVGSTADPESAGLIGSLVWKHFVLVLDYRHERVWLDPRPPAAPTAGAKVRSRRR